MHKLARETGVIVSYTSAEATARLEKFDITCVWANCVWAKGVSHNLKNTFTKKIAKLTG